MAVITAGSVADVPHITRSPGFWHGVVRRICRDPVALIALTVIVLLVAIAIFGPYLAPHDLS